MEPLAFCEHFRLPGVCLDFMQAAIGCENVLEDLAGGGLQSGNLTAYFGSFFVRDLARLLIDNKRLRAEPHPESGNYIDSIRRTLGAVQGETTFQAAKRVVAELMRSKQDRDLSRSRLEGIENQFAAAVRSLNVCLSADEPWMGKLPEALARVRKRLAEAETGRDAALEALRTGHVSAEQAPGETANEALSRLRVERDRYRAIASELKAEQDRMAQPTHASKKLRNAQRAWARRPPTLFANSGLEAWMQAMESALGKFETSATCTADSKCSP